MCKKNKNCGCGGNHICGCDIELSIKCVKNDIKDYPELNFFKGDSLEDFIEQLEDLKLDFILGIDSIFLGNNIGDGAKIYDHNNSSNEEDFRTLKGSESINVEQGQNTINFEVDINWLKEVIKHQSIKNISIQPNKDGTGIVVIDGVNIGTVLLQETVTTLVNNGNGTFTYTSENGTETTFSSQAGSLSISNLLVNGNLIGTITDGNNSYQFKETVTVIEDLGNGTYRYTNESGATYDIKASNNLNVVTYDSKNPRPTTGEIGVIYIDTDTDTAFIWDADNNEYVSLALQVDLSSYTLSGGYTGTAQDLNDAIIALQNANTAVLTYNDDIKG